MSVRRPDQPPGSAPLPDDAGLRRTRYGSMAAVLITSYTAILLFIAAIAGRGQQRWDVTSTREHSLSARTLGVLQNLADPVEIVLSTDPGQTTPAARQRVGDVLDAFTRASRKVSVVTIDTGSPDAASQVAALVGRMAERHQDAIDADRRTLTEVADQLAAIAERSPTVGAAAEGLASALAADPQREALAEAATLTRALSADLSRAAAGVREAASGSVVGVPLPQGDTAQRAAEKPLADFTATIDRLTQLLSGIDSETSRALTPDVAALRDAGLTAADRLARLKPLEPLMVARLLQARQAVLVITARGVQAIDFQSLFPRTEAAGSRAQVLFAGEELIGSAIASLTSSVTPILVLVHAEPDALLDDRGRPTRAAAPRLGRVADRLQLRRIGLAEWAVARSPSRPNFSTLNPDRSRPVVWFVLGAPPRTALTARGDAAAERATRIGKLAAAVQGLLDAGDSVLIAVEPSELPGAGEPDPLVEPLKALGVSIESGKPIIERLTAPGIARFSAYQTVRRAARGHPVADAVDGLAVILHWPSAITLAPTPPAGVTLRALLDVEATDSRWGESQWTALRALNIQAPLTPMAPRDPPTRSEGRDLTRGPFTLAAAVERLRGAGTPQRVVIVASPSWYEDLYAMASSAIEGRRVSLFPGNAELFDTALLWLAHLDDQIAPSAQARDVSRITSLSPGQISAIRWGLIGGLPAAVLGLGLVCRWVSNRPPRKSASRAVPPTS